MRLSALLEPEVMVVGGDPAATEVAGLCADSRALRPGMLFAALGGSRQDGRAFVSDALARGAAAVLAGPELERAELPVPLVVDPLPRRRLALMAARFHGAQPRWIAAVTGTNGKTSVAHFTTGIWRTLGRRAATLGTLGLDAPDRRIEGGLTTPDPVRLHELLADLARGQVEHLALEASSHGLSQHRLDGLVLRAAAFTNLSRDHFDYHGSVEAYWQAKRRLFDELLPPGGTLVANADEPQFEELLALATRRKLEILDYGKRGRRLRLVGHDASAGGQTLQIEVDGWGCRVTTPLLGSFQAWNLLAALGLAIACGAEPASAAHALGSLRAPPGRMERIVTTTAGGAVLVDYAHTPDALARALDSLRPSLAGRLLVVFGCGGDRDPGKRAAMGRVAAERADLVIVTDDNPRSEDPAAIRRAVLTGSPDALEIGDRRAAIRRAAGLMRSGDVLLIAGKGHEAGQIVGDRTFPFDDAAEARAAVVALAGEPS